MRHRWIDTERPVRVLGSGQYPAAQHAGRVGRVVAVAPPGPRTVSNVLLDLEGQLVVTTIYRVRNVPAKGGGHVG